MAKHTKRFKRLAKFIFDKLCDNRLDSPNISKWLAELLECTKAIKQESKFTLSKDSKWMRLHGSISGIVTDLLAADKPFEDVVIDREKRMVTVTVLEPRKIDHTSRMS
jgi:hypothetical protein